MTSDAKYFVHGIIILVTLAIIISWGIIIGENCENAPDDEIVYATMPATPSSVPIHHPVPIPEEKRYVPHHADGDPRECGTCHTYPSYDENNNPYRKAPSQTPASSSTPAPPIVPQKTKQFTIHHDSPIPQDYYSQDCELPACQSMQEYLANSDWVNDYDAGGWDCSQMSAYMEFMLENCGYNVVIRVANGEDGEHSHAWVLVEFQEGWLAYECTGRYWVYPSESVARSYEPDGYAHWNPSMYDAGVRYESIHAIWNAHKQYSNGEEVFLNEYGWWTQ